MVTAAHSNMHFAETSPDFSGGKVSKHWVQVTCLHPCVEVGLLFGELANWGRRLLRHGLGDHLEVGAKLSQAASKSGQGRGQ